MTLQQLTTGHWYRIAYNADDKSLAGKPVLYAGGTWRTTGDALRVPVRVHGHANEEWLVKPSLLIAI